MYPINDRQYLTICAKIAALMSISLSAAKKKVEIKIAQKAAKNIEEKRQIALELLKSCEKDEESKFSSSKILDNLMATLDNEDNFLTED